MLLQHKRHPVRQCKLISHHAQKGSCHGIKAICSSRGAMRPTLQQSTATAAGLSHSSTHGMPSLVLALQTARSLQQQKFIQKVPHPYFFQSHTSVIPNKCFSLSGPQIFQSHTCTKLLILKWETGKGPFCTWTISSTVIKQHVVMCMTSTSCTAKRRDTADHSLIMTTYLSIIIWDNFNDIIEHLRLSTIHWRHSLRLFRKSHNTNTLEISICIDTNSTYTWQN